MKIYIMETEWWPIYIVYEEEPGDIGVNVCDGFLDEYKSVRKEFDKMQKTLRELILANGGKVSAGT